jgi:hypothetical protein
MARKHSKYGFSGDSHRPAEAPATVVDCWLCARPTGKTIVWHHPVPKSRGGRDVVPMLTKGKRTRKPKAYPASQRATSGK